MILTTVANGITVIRNRIFVKYSITLVLTSLSKLMYLVACHSLIFNTVFP
jgi:hypothetical protein